MWEKFVLLLQSFRRLQGGLNAKGKCLQSPITPSSLKLPRMPLEGPLRALSKFQIFEELLSGDGITTRQPQMKDLSIRMQQRGPYRTEVLVTQQTIITMWARINPTRFKSTSMMTPGISISSRILPMARTRVEAGSATLKTKTQGLGLMQETLTSDRRAHTVR